MEDESVTIQSESHIENEIRECLSLLGISDESPKTLELIDSKVQLLLKSLPSNYLEPLIQTDLNEEEYKKLEEINCKFSKEYVSFKKNSLQRLDSIMGVFFKKIPHEDIKLIRERRQKLNPYCDISVLDIFNAKDDLIKDSLKAVSSEDLGKSKLKGVYPVEIVKEVKKSREKGKKKKMELKVKRAEKEKKKIERVAAKPLTKAQRKRMARLEGQIKINENDDKVKGNEEGGEEEGDEEEGDEEGGEEEPENEDYNVEPENEVKEEIDIDSRKQRRKKKEQVKAAKRKARKLAKQQKMKNNQENDNQEDDNQENENENDNQDNSSYSNTDNEDKSNQSTEKGDTENDDNQDEK